MGVRKLVRHPWFSYPLGVGFLPRVRDLLSGGVTGYRAEASIDLDVLDSRDDIAKLLVGIDLQRLERVNRQRHRAKPRRFWRSER